MSFWAYMLHCRGGAFNTGHTDNLEVRLEQHRVGAVPGFTAKLLPVELVWSQEFPTRIEALESERRIKGWSRAKKLALIRGDWDEISELAKGKTVLRQAQDERIAGGNQGGGGQDERIAGGNQGGGGQDERIAGGSPGVGAQGERNEEYIA